MSDLFMEVRKSANVIKAEMVKYEDALGLDIAMLQMVIDEYAFEHGHDPVEFWTKLYDNAMRVNKEMPMSEDYDYQN